MEVFDCHRSLFEVLASHAKYTIRLKRMLIKESPKEVGIFLAEACHNLLQDNLPFSPEEKAVLKKSKEIIRRIPAKKRKADLLTAAFIKILPVLLKLVKKRRANAQIQ